MVGIKGQGVSALARVLAELGVDVVGSDTPAAFATDFRLQHPRVKVISGFSADNVPTNTGQLVYSAGYPLDHPEIAAARAMGIPIASYPEFVGWMTKIVPTIGVAGTHGKTTTVQLLGHMLHGLGQDPVLIGGGGPVYAGRDDLLIVESCEYRRHFLNYRPTWAVITNIDFDHPDSYADLDAVRRAFQEFVSGTARGGVVVLTDNCQESGNLKLAPDTRLVLTGLSEKAHVRGIVEDTGPCRFRVKVEGRDAGTAQTQLWGMHNIYNALQALGVLYSMGHDLEPAVKTLPDFVGVPRRLEFIGTVGRAKIYDDFAHHPSEIRASIRALREMEPSRLVIVFQPHTYSRTRALLAEFGRELSAADDVVLVPVYGSVREQSGAIGSEELAERLPSEKVRVLSVEEVLGFIREIEAPGVMVVYMGCGDIGMSAREVVCVRPDGVPAYLFDYEAGLRAHSKA
jgi:UDP-N-acetylmuramate--alanine ligase